MNKVLFFFCNLISVLGIGILFTTTILNKVFPMLGRVAFQSAMAGGYSPEDYIMDFKLINLFAVLLIVVGFGVGFYIYQKENTMTKIESNIEN